MEQDNLDSWDAFTGNYLKAEDVKSEEYCYAVIGISSEKLDDKPRVCLHLERKGIRKDFTLNATNIKKAREFGIEHPKALIGKVIYFKIIETQTPKGETVNGIRIKSITEPEKHY